MGELNRPYEPSINPSEKISSSGFRYPRTRGSNRNVVDWYRASAAGTIACIILYTVFGLVLVILHSRNLSAESEVLMRFGMTTLIKPDDPHLIFFSHQLASALFIGLTLGALNALVCILLTIPAWLSGRFYFYDLIAAVVGVLCCIFFSFSYEKPLMSIGFGLLCPVVFTLPWVYVLRKPTRQFVNMKRWIVFCFILVSPVIMLISSGSTFLAVRDSMLSNGFTRALSNFYYEHTLLAADVIKPVYARSQNVIALADDVNNIGHTPHGTLWIRTNDPCSVKGARFSLTRHVLPCASVFYPEIASGANARSLDFETLTHGLDPNRYMRKGIGIFFFGGPFIVIIILLVSWLGLGFERLFNWNKYIALIFMIAYVSFNAPMLYGAYIIIHLKSSDGNISEYVVSSNEQKRYAAITVYPHALDNEDILRLMNDSSSRIRINALIEAGERGYKEFIPAIVERLSDLQLNVRTKACWALGKIESPQTLKLLEKTAKCDSSWYVRDYAYAAIGRISPETKVVSLR